MIRIVTIVGARPQFIKAASVSRAIKGRSGAEEILIHTGQHYDTNMSDIFFRDLDIRPPDHHLGIGGGTHGQNTGRMIEAIEGVLSTLKPDWVLVHGDTDSTLAGTLAAVKLHLRVAHVEAGLRSFNRRMPEEINRVLTDHAASLLFAPTATAVRHLAAEGITGSKVRLVGDVMYDAALFYRDRARKPALPGIADGDFTLCTIHRAENTDDPARLAAILGALEGIAREEPVVLPLHPRTAKAVAALAGGSFPPGVKVIDPVGFLEMNWLLSRCALVMTDSGGVQKEAYFHAKPCVTLRDETEWVELVEAGCNRLAPPGAGGITSAYRSMRTLRMAGLAPLYGDGNAAGLILDSLLSPEMSRP